jgi:hypothetical protein
VDASLARSHKPNLEGIFIPQESIFFQLKKNNRTRSACSTGSRIVTNAIMNIFVAKLSLSELILIGKTCHS